MGKVKSTYCILYGFNKQDEDDLAYFAVVNGHSATTTEEECAFHFPMKKRRGQKGFGTPQQWCDYINEDDDLNHGYKFHLVHKIL